MAEGQPPQHPYFVVKHDESRDHLEKESGNSKPSYLVAHLFEKHLGGIIS